MKILSKLSVKLQSLQVASELETAMASHKIQAFFRPMYEA